jgi:cytochrome c biogenesis protein CcmG, thiol:disulfide interchange protein DsbE
MNLRTWLAVGTLVAAGHAGAEELAEVGRPAPIFRLPVYNAQAVGLNTVGIDRFIGPDAPDKQVKVVLLSFMASFCAPCKKEMPWLQALHERYSGEGLRVVMVSIDTEPEGQKIVSDLIAEHNVTYPVLKDRFNLVARRWLGQKSPLPSVFLVAPDARIGKVLRGYSEEVTADLQREVEKALGVPPSTIVPPAVAKAPSPELKAEEPAPKAEPVKGKKRAPKARPAKGTSAQTTAR